MFLRSIRRAAASLRLMLGPPPLEPEPEGMSPTEKLVLLILVDGHRKNASQIRIAFGSGWSSYGRLYRRLTRTCEVAYVVDGTPIVIMKPPVRLSDDLVATVDRYLAEEHARGDPEDAATEFSWIPRPLGELDDEPVPPVMRFRVCHETEAGAAVLVLTPV